MSLVVEKADFGLRVASLIVEKVYFDLEIGSLMEDKAGPHPRIVNPPRDVESADR